MTKYGHIWPYGHRAIGYEHRYVGYPWKELSKTRDQERPGQTGRDQDSFLVHLADLSSPIWSSFSENGKNAFQPVSDSTGNLWSMDVCVRVSKIAFDRPAKQKRWASHNEMTKASRACGRMGNGHDLVILRWRYNWKRFFLTCNIWWLWWWLCQC